MIAALPMYDFGDLVPANDAFWGLIRHALRDAGQAAPDHLTHGAPDLWRQWKAPDLVLSQTCGYPFRNHLHGHVTLVGTPDYGLPGCPPGHYHSVFVARADDHRSTLGDFRGARLAYNDVLSQSGWSAAQTHLGSLGLPPLAGLQTGSHRASALAAADGRADLASLDAVTWRHLQRLDHVTQRLRVLDRTLPTPGLPLISRAGADGAALFHAVAHAIAALPAGARATLGITGLIAIPAEHYLRVPNAPASLPVD